MPLSVGDKLGHYEVLSLLGQGGMGEVYRARDTMLKRDVALKVLPPTFFRDHERMARFQREAEVLASLDHPNIGHIHGIVDSEDSRGLVLALIEGPTLADRIAAGPVPIDEAVAIAKQIIDALEYAHDRGVVHRDLKPANIKITSEGVVKVLDFGLAKVLEDEPLPSSLANSPTLTLGHTRAGVILGTAAYMSPEQAIGRPVDRRSDIFSFGAVLFEMLAGKRAFGGTTTPDVLEAVVKTDPDWFKLPAGTPGYLRRFLERMLAKDRKQRLQAIGEARIALENAPSEPEPAGAGVRVTAQSRLGLVSVAVLLLTVIGLGFIAYRQVREEPPRLMKFLVPPPDKGTFNQGNSYTLAVSPDGNRVAFLATVEARDQIWLRDLGSTVLRPLPGTEGSVGAPFWSPDSRFVGFFAGGKLKKMDVAGGPAVALCEAPEGRSGSWSKNDVIVFQASPTGPLFRVPGAGGNATAVTELDQSSGEISHRFPWFLPDNRHFLYTALSTEIDGKTAVYVGDLDSKSRQKVLTGPTNAAYVSGYLLFGRDQALMAQPFDLSKLTVTGEAVPVAEQLAGSQSNARLQFSASQNGVIAYVMSVNGNALQLTWFDRSGRALGTVGPPGRLQWGTISPDGDSVAFDRQDPQTNLSDVWVHDLTRGTDSRFTFNSHSNQFPVWSPDGRYIAFQTQTGSGTGNIERKAVNGVGREEVLVKDIPARPDDWSGDGRYLMLGTAPGRSKTGSDILVLPVAPNNSGDHKPSPFLQTTFNEASAKLSPDGRWLAYRSDETKQYEIYVQTFPAPGGKWQVSTNGGAYPVWSKNGKELFFLQGTKMMAVDVRGTGAKFEAGVPKPLFDVRFPFGNAWFDVSKDGRFLIPTPVGDSANPSMMVVLNWTAGLKN